MNRKEQVTKLTASGELTQLFCNGLVSGKALMYRDMFFDYDVQIKTGSKSMDAVQLVADRYGVTIQTVYRAIRWMNE